MLHRSSSTMERRATRSMASSLAGTAGASSPSLGRPMASSSSRALLIAPSRFGMPRRARPCSALVLFRFGGRRLIPHRTYTIADTPVPEYQQVGNIWSRPEEVISLSSSGDLNIFDTRSNSVSRVLSGHQKGITALARSAATSTLFSGSYDGRVHSFTKGGNECRPVKGAGHSNGVVALAATGDRVASVGMDDSLRFIETSSTSFRSVRSASL